MKTSPWQIPTTPKQPATNPPPASSRTARKSLRRAVRKVTRRAAG
jgi:hypothetical protein